MKIKQLSLYVRGASGLVLAGLIGVGVTACNSSSSSLEAPPPDTLTGVFVDSAVAGIGYRTASQADDRFTNDEGEFNYLAGEQVTFFIGDVELPPVTGKDILTPRDIFETDDFTDRRVINLARLLQSLDEDGIPENGIQIADAAHTAATGLDLDFDVSEEEFEDNPDVINLVSTGGRPEGTLVDVKGALAHLLGTSLVGAWYHIDSETYITVAFMADGTYMHAEVQTVDPDPNGEDGIEYGNWSWSPVSHQMEVDVMFDGNGQWGLSDTSPDESFRRLGNGLEIIDHEANESWTLVLAESDANPLVGGWELKIPEEDTVIVLVLTGDRFSLSQFSPTDAGGEPGAEFGTYTWNQDSGAFIPVVEFNGNGDWGFSHEASDITAVVDGDVLTISYSGEDDVVTLTRVK